MKHQNFDKNHLRSTFMRTNMRKALVKRPPGRLAGSPPRLSRPVTTSGPAFRVARPGGCISKQLLDKRPSNEFVMQ